MKYKQKESTNPNQITSLRNLWEKSLDGNVDFQFYTKIPPSFR